MAAQWVEFCFKESLEAFLDAVLLVLLEKIRALPAM
jgi:hypothetical protein